MNLKKDNTDPKRVFSWQGKSLAICSRKELIQCVLHLVNQLHIAEESVQQRDKIIDEQIPRSEKQVPEIQTEGV
jgi:hypothetical protein